MTETVINAPAAVRAVLAATGSLATRCGTDIYVGEIPDSVTWSNNRPALVIQAMGGTLDHDFEQHETELLFRCYGGSAKPIDAAATYKALIETAHGQDRYDIATGAGACVQVIQVDEMQITREPDTGWPVVLATGSAIVRPS